MAVRDDIWQGYSVAELLFVSKESQCCYVACWVHTSLSIVVVVVSQKGLVVGDVVVPKTLLPVLWGRWMDHLG